MKLSKLSRTHKAESLGKSDLKHSRLTEVLSEACYMRTPFHFQVFERDTLGEIEH